MADNKYAGTQTEKNLQEALAGESQARNKYTYFASVASVSYTHLDVYKRQEFIPLLEETGLIIPAGGYILNEAAAMCCEMQKYIPDFRMNVNVSYVQILQGNVERDILDAIQKYSLQTECLCVEMTESGFMDMTPSFCKFRKTLDKNGIPFVIDDFGTGYSNLHCIRDMNPSYVKMDRDFTAKAMNSDSCLLYTSPEKTAIFYRPFYGW